MATEWQTNRLQSEQAVAYCRREPATLSGARSGAGRHTGFRIKEESLYRSPLGCWLKQSRGNTMKASSSPCAICGDRRPHIKCPNEITVVTKKRCPKCGKQTLRRFISEADGRVYADCPHCSYAWPIRQHKS